MEPSEQFFGVKPDVSGRRVFWDQVAGQYPNYAMDPGVHELAAWMTHAGGVAEPNAQLDQPETSYRRMRVALSDIQTFGLPDAADPLVLRVAEGFAAGEDVPPAIFVHRAGVFDIADGHHQVVAAGLLGMPEVEAFVSESPHATPIDADTDLGGEG